MSYITPLRAVLNEPPITVTWEGDRGCGINYRYCIFMVFTVSDPSCMPPLIYLLIIIKIWGSWRSFWCLSLTVPVSVEIWHSAVYRRRHFGNWLFIYMTGGYIGIHGSSAVESKNTSWLLLLASTICGSGVLFFKYSPSMFTNLMYLLLFAAALWCVLSASWAASDGGKLAEASTFIVYMTHFLIVRGMNVLVSKYLSRIHVAGTFVFPASGALLCADITVLADLWKRPVLRVENVVWKSIERGKLITYAGNKIQRPVFCHADPVYRGWNSG